MDNTSKTKFLMKMLVATTVVCLALCLAACSGSSRQAQPRELDVTGMTLRDAYTALTEEGWTVDAFHDETISTEHRQSSLSVEKGRRNTEYVVSSVKFSPSKPHPTSVPTCIISYRSYPANHPTDIHPYIQRYSYMEEYTSDQISYYIGMNRGIYGVVYGVKYASDSNGRPLFIDIGGDFPNQHFTIVVWEENRGEFEPVGSPEEFFAGLSGKWVVVNGVPYTYNDRIYIEVVHPLQVTSLDDLEELAKASDG